MVAWFEGLQEKKAQHSAMLLVRGATVIEGRRRYWWESEGCKWIRRAEIAKRKN